MNIQKLYPYTTLIVISACLGSSAALAEGHGGMHGGGGHHCAHHAGKGPLAPHWRTTLTEEQRVELDKLKLAYVEEKAVLKAKGRVTKVELAVLATADKVDQAAIDQKIDELVELKRAGLRKKYEYIAAKRGVLTEQQRVSFDMDVIEKAAKGKGKGKGKGHGGAKH